MIADRVGKLACEVEEKITLHEFWEWNAFFKLEAEEMKKESASIKRKR